MWIFTRHGFVSAVNNWHDPSSLIVRARDRQSLERLRKATGSAIEHSPVADYPYRLMTTKEAFAAWAAREVSDIDYPNFKAEVEAVRGDDYGDTLLKVWSAMHGVEDPEARNRP